MHAVSCLGKECQDSDKLKADDYCGSSRGLVKRASIRNNAAQLVWGA